MRFTSTGCSKPQFSGSCRLAPLVVLAMFLIVFTTGCVGQHDPTGYGDSVKENFVKGCTTGLSAGQDHKASATQRSMCVCLYEQISDKQTGIPFEDFKSVQGKIREDPTNPANTIDKLIPKFDQYRTACENKTVPGPHA